MIVILVIITFLFLDYIFFNILFESTNYINNLSNLGLISKLSKKQIANFIIKIKHDLIYNGLKNI